MLMIAKANNNVRTIVNCLVDETIFLCYEVMYVPQESMYLTDPRVEDDLVNYQLGKCRFGLADI